MKLLATVLLASLLVPASALAAGDADQPQRCSTRMVAGRWLFATGMGHVLAPAPPFSGQGITAIGTMNIDRHGNVKGRFDNTIAGFGSFEHNLYWGTIEVNEDCTGRLHFTTSSGSMRTDSIAVLNDSEMWGMSLSETNPWTYTSRRVGRR